MIIITNSHLINYNLNYIKHTNINKQPAHIDKKKCPKY